VIWAEGRELRAERKKGVHADFADGAD